MLNRRELQSPILPESAKPNFFDFELKYNEFENALSKSKTIGGFFFLLTVILVIKPIILLQLSRISEVSSIVYLSVFACLFGEVFIASRNWHHRSSLSWHWLPLISLVASIMLAATGNFLMAGFSLTFAGLEFAAIIIPEKFRSVEPLWKMEFFSDNLWQDTQQLGRIKDCEEYSEFRIRKTSLLVKVNEKEMKNFRLWSIIFLYLIVVMCELVFVYSNFSSFEIIALMLILCIVSIVYLLVQVANSRFYPMFIYFLGVLSALNIFLLIDSQHYFLVVIDVVMIGAMLTFIFRYFSKFHFVRAISFNYYDLIALLDSKNTSLAQLSFDTLKENTGLNLPLAKDIWLERLVKHENKLFISEN
ncbi:MAG: hypothetical protein K8S87_10060 [Planctomycetes bacterium]|nr:hypothetical protein [Planctomycetota bacterium]